MKGDMLTHIGFIFSFLVFYLNRTELEASDGFLNGHLSCRSACPLLGGIGDI